LEDGDESGSDERLSGLASEGGEVVEKDCSNGLGSRSKSDLLVDVAGLVLPLEEGWRAAVLELVVGEDDVGRG
jgi:hypothetical protein